MLIEILEVELKTLDIIVLTIGCFTSLFSLVQFFRKDNPLASFYWPKSRAKILSCSIKEDCIYNNKNNLKQTLYRPIITFEYLFQSKKYTSSSYTMFTFATRSKSKALSKSRKYPVDMIVPVFINPKKPKQAYIELSKTRAFLFCLSMSVFIIGFPVISILLVIYRIR